MRVAPPLRQPLGGALLILFSAPVPAGEILDSRVWTEGDRYLIHVEARLQAHPARVQHHLTDYANLHRLSDTITGSELLAADPPAYQVRVRSEGCILFFCRRLVQVQWVTERPDGYLIVEDIPGRSDFQSARAVWQVRADGDRRTRLHYSGEFVPDFWVPPLLGPPLLRHRLEQEARHVIDNLERLARETPER